MSKNSQAPKRGRRAKCEPEFYINNREFYQEILRYFYMKSIDSSIPIPECIWIKFRKLAMRIASRTNFSGYTYKSEFISDAIILCVQKINKFDPIRSRNPFAFFTTAIMNCFIGRIEKEKRESIYKDHFLHAYGEREDMISRGQEFIAERLYSGF